MKTVLMVSRYTFVGVSVAVGFLSTSYLFLFVLVRVVLMVPEEGIPGLFRSPILAMLCFCVSIVFIFFIGRFSIRVEVEAMENRCSRLVDERFEKLGIFIEFAQLLLDNDAKELIADFSRELKEQEMLPQNLSSISKRFDERVQSVQRSRNDR